MYKQLCASCHGNALEGTDRAKGLFDRKPRNTWADLIRPIRTGIIDKGMRSQGGGISPGDMEKLADFILEKIKAKPASVR